MVCIGGCRFLGVHLELLLTHTAQAWQEEQSVPLQLVSVLTPVAQLSSPVAKGLQ